MRIALLCHSCLGGSSRVASRLAYELERRGHQALLVSASPPPAPSAELAAIRLEPFEEVREARWTTVIEPTWDTQRLASLERHVETLVRRHAVQVVHYHYAWPFANVVGRLKARLRPSPPAFMGTLHGTDVTHPAADGSGATLRDTDVHTTVSCAYARLAQEQFDLPEAPLVIPNFVDPEQFPRSVDFADRAAGGRKPRVVHVSNFRAVKNPRDVARIFLALRERIGAELWLVGEGPGLPQLQAELDRAGVGDDLRVLGYRSDIGAVLAQCDLLLMTSWEESFCLAVLEAMASGLAVVATAVGGLAEVVQHGRTAMLFEPGDWEDGAGHAVRLLTDDDFRLRMRRLAAGRARDFSADAVVGRYEALYELAASRVAPPQELVADGAL